MSSIKSLLSPSRSNETFGRKFTKKWAGHEGADESGPGCSNRNIRFIHSPIDSTQHIIRLTLRPPIQSFLAPSRCDQAIDRKWTKMAGDGAQTATPFAAIFRLNASTHRFAPKTKIVQHSKNYRIKKVPSKSVNNFIS